VAARRRRVDQRGTDRQIVHDLLEGAQLHRADRAAPQVTAERIRFGGLERAECVGSDVAAAGLLVAVR
jgi:hypothetical protein